MRGHTAAACNAQSIGIGCQAGKSDWPREVDVWTIKD